MSCSFLNPRILLAGFAILAACGNNTPAHDTDGGSRTGGMDGGTRDSSVPVCPTTGDENTLALCSDGCDNEPDGFADCDDFNCCGVRTDCPADSHCGRHDAGAECATGVPEDTSEACMDGCDNDSDEFADCNDFDCCDVRADCPATSGCGRRGDAGVPMTYTIAQLQDRADPMHPSPGARVNVDQPGMVALTKRLLVGAADGGSGRNCRFAVWVGASSTADFTAIQVQETIRLPEGMTDCLALPAGKISDEFAPGDSVTAINNASYGEFCASAAGPRPMPCTDFEQSNIFLGGTATIERAAPGTAPTPATAALADLVSEAGAPGPRTVALEGGLVRVEGVRVKSRVEMMGDRSFTTYAAFIEGAPTVELDIVIQNFPATRCVRGEFDRLAMGTTTSSLTGVLMPNFGRWTLRLRDEADVEGLTCAETGVDGGVPDSSVPACAEMAAENTAEACMDGCDNEPDRFVDCDDFDCCAVRADCPPASGCGRRRDAH